MKIVYTKEEVSEIVLQHAKAQINDDLNEISISTYSEDFCTLTIKPVEKVEETPIDLSEIPF